MALKIKSQMHTHTHTFNLVIPFRSLTYGINQRWHKTFVKDECNDTYEECSLKHYLEYWKTEEAYISTTRDYNFDIFMLGKHKQECLRLPSTRYHQPGKCWWCFVK